MLLRFIFIITLVASSPAHAVTQGDLISGFAVIVDGDTLDIGHLRIRLWGIDAPEKRASCIRQNERWRPARKASDALLACTKGATITCRVQKVQRRFRGMLRERYVSECWRDDNKADVAACMVSSGWATDYPGYSGGHYGGLEAAPKANRAGIWQCAGEPPTSHWCGAGEGVPCEAIYTPVGPPKWQLHSNAPPWGN